MKNIPIYKKTGQSPLISHTLVVGFGLIVVLLTVTAINSIRSNYQEFSGENEIQVICSLIKSGIEKIYIENDYISPMNTTKGEIKLELPLRIADMNYRAKFVNTSLYIQTLSNPVINYTCKIGFNLTYNGTTNGGRTKLVYTEYSNGEERITMSRI